jgi:hypothetical protein
MSIAAGLAIAAVLLWAAARDARIDDAQRAAADEEADR